MHKAAAALVILLLSAWVPVLAQVDAAKERLIRELLVLTKTEALADQMTAVLKPQMVGLVMSQFRTLIPNPDDEVTRIVEEAFAKEFGALQGEFMAMWLVAYDRHFSMQELTDLNAFYRTPLGQMTVDKMPKLQAELMQVGQFAGQAAGRRAAQEALTKLQALGKLPARQPPQ